MPNPQTAASEAASSIRWRPVLAQSLAGLALVSIGFGWGLVRRGE